MNSLYNIVIALFCVGDVGINRKKRFIGKKDHAKCKESFNEALVRHDSAIKKSQASQETIRKSVAEWKKSSEEVSDYIKQCAENLK